MLGIILPIIFASVISFLITMDASSVNLYFGTAEFLDIPLFFVVLAAMIIGMILASVATIKNLITSRLTIMGKNSDLKKSYKSSDQLQGKVNKLEEENLVLKEQNKEQAYPKEE